jgi:hypothetical protein
LLAEPYAGSGSAEQAAANGGFPDDWFYGGEKRPTAFRTLEQKPAPPIVLDSEQWTPEKPAKHAWDRKVMVVQFVRPEFEFSIAQVEQIKDVAKKFTPQGVVFVAVCDARSEWDRMLEEVTSREINWTAMHDMPLPEDQVGGGVTTQAYGVTFGPATVVIDRLGVVRAAGLKTDRLETVINTLMAERIPARPADAKTGPPESKEAKKGTDH